jgi:hypothetical protein
MLGWKELAQKVDQASSKLSNDGQTLILCDNYGQAGAINYYSKNKNSKAVSFNADYINWFDFDDTIENLILVKEFDHSKEAFDKIKPFFGTAAVSGSITNSYAREYRTTIFIFTRPKIDIIQYIKTKVEAQKSSQ